MPEKEKTKPEMTEAERAALWQKRFSRCETNQETLFKKASKHYDIMYAVQSTDNIAPWRAKIYVPIMASKAWDLIARLSSVLPYFRTRVNNEMMFDADEGKIVVPEDVLNKQQRIDSKLYYDYCYGQDEPMKLKVFDTMLDAVVAGTGFAKAPWAYGTQTSRSRDYNSDGFVKDMGTEKVKEVKAGKNDFEPVNFFNVFVGDNAVSYQKSKYVLVRYFKAIDDLKGKGYKNVDKLNKSPDKGNFDIHNQARNRVVNENRTDENDETVPTATIFEVYERTPEGVICGTYGVGEAKQGWVEMEKPFKKYWHNYYPVQPFYIRRKSYSPWGESLFENNSSLQYATNDLFNHYLDNWNLSIDAMIMYEDGTLTSDYVVEPGGEITYTGEKPDAFKFPEPNPAQLSMVMNVIDKAVENATVPQYLSGVPNSSIDKTAGTAKGITSISEAASEKIGYMRDNFKQSMTIIGKMWLSNLQQFQDRAEEIRTYEKGEEKPDIILPEDYKGDFDLTIDDDSLVPMSKDEKRSALESLTAQAMMIQKAAVEQANILGTKEFIPKVNYSEILDESVQYYAVRDPMRFIIKDSDIKQAPQEMPEDVASLGEMVGGAAPEMGQDPGLAASQGQEGAAFGGYSQ
jgi:hypothetical protein